jgi:hypothetical protein
MGDDGQVDIRSLGCFFCQFYRDFVSGIEIFCFHFLLKIIHVQQYSAKGSQLIDMSCGGMIRGGGGGKTETATFAGHRFPVVFLILNSLDQCKKISSNHIVQLINAQM